jgi:hypothetical protein
MNKKVPPNKKRCTKCGKIKNYSEFHKNKNEKDGFGYWCKDCARIVMKIWRNKNKEHRKNYIKNWRKKNKDHVRDYNKVNCAKWRKLNPNYNKKYFKTWYKENEKKHKETGKKWYLANKEYMLKKMKEYQKNNKDKIRATRRKWEKKERRNNINYKIMQNLRSRLRDAIKKGHKSKRTLKLLGCSLDKLKQHLESKFTKGMSWETYGLYGWHIDHIRPCCTFDLSKPKEQLKCFNYKNLRPLWAKDNLERRKDGRKRY